MKKIITLNLIIIFLLLFSPSIISYGKTFANTDNVKCSALVEISTPDEGSTVKVKIDNVEEHLKENKYEYLQIFIIRKSIWVDLAEISGYKITSSGIYEFSTKSSRIGTGSWEPGNYEVEINTPSEFFFPRGHTVTSCFFVLNRIAVISPEEIEESYKSLCSGNEDCLTCLKHNNSWTALGCLQTSGAGTFVNYLIKLSISIAGGIAFLLIILGGFQIILSGGSPEKVKAGKEMITSAIAGLFLIIFAVFILKLIGVDILKIFKT